MSRREFMVAAGAAAAFTIVPRHVLGGSGHTPPSEKLNIAGIGIGGQGASDLAHLDSENIVALCDVDERYAAGTFQKYPQAKKYTDFRRMLEKQKDIDAVLVATPDHTHAVMSMWALKMGKHVYCQKPLTHNIHEARRLAKAAREAKVATQMGNQGLASERVRRVCEFISDGAIGSVREVHDWTDRPIWPQGIGRPQGRPPVPDTLDWDLWLGPAPQRPYHPAYLPFKWRGWWDFGAGALGDMACHSFAPIFKALKLGHPTSVEICSTYKGEFNNESYPLAEIVRYQFPARQDMPEVTLTWYDGGLKPATPPELEDQRSLGSNGVLYIGDKGKMLDGRLIPESKMAEYEQPPKTLPRSPGHYREWIEACKGRGECGSNFDFASLVTEVVLLGNVALRAGHRLEWDGEKVTNLPGANQYLGREYREGWSLDGPQV